MPIRPGNNLGSLLASYGATTGDGGGGGREAGWNNYNAAHQSIYDGFRQQALAEGRAQGLTGTGSDGGPLDQFASNRAQQLMTNWGSAQHDSMTNVSGFGLLDPLLQTYQDHPLATMGAIAGGAYGLSALGGAGAGAAAGTGGELSAADAAALGDMTAGGGATQGLTAADAAALGDMTAAAGVTQGMTGADAATLGDMTGGTAGLTGADASTLGDMTGGTGATGATGSTGGTSGSGGGDTLTGGDAVGDEIDLQDNLDDLGDGGNIFDPDPSKWTAADWSRLIGAFGPSLLGAYGSNEMANAYTHMFDTLRGDRLPYLQASQGYLADPSSYFKGKNAPGNVAINSTLRGLSVTGNPFGSPFKMEMAGDAGMKSWLNAVNSLGALGTGGETAQLAAGSGAINADASGLNSLGYGLGSYFNPQPTLADLMKGWKAPGPT